MVGVACGGVEREHDQACGVAVNAVDGGDVVQAEFVFEAHQHGFLQVLARRHNGQEVRFVHHHQVRIVVQHNLVKWNGRFLRQVAIVVDAKAGFIRRLRGDGATAVVHHVAVGEAFAPGVCADMLKTLDQKFKHRRPLPRRQHRATGRHAVARGGRVGAKTGHGGAQAQGAVVPAALIRTMQRAA